MSVYELTGVELYSQYTPGKEPEDLIAEGRTRIAQRLMGANGLTQEEAYYAADQILEYAQDAAGADRQ